jgi:hypothetical protein
MNPAENVVAATGGVDDVYLERRHFDGFLFRNDQGTFAALRYRHAGRAGSQQMLRAGQKVRGPSETQHLFVVGQQVVGVQQGVSDPLQQPRIPVGENVDGRAQAVGLCVLEQLAGRRTPEKLGTAQMKVR